MNCPIVVTPLCLQRSFLKRSPLHPPDASFATRTSPTTLTATLICFPWSPPKSAPTGKRAPPAVHSSPSAPLLPELRFRIQLPFLPVPPALRGSRSRAHTRALTLPLPRSGHPTLRCCRSSVGREGGQVTSGLQSRGERLERAVRSLLRMLEAHSGSHRSRAPPSLLHPLSRCAPAGEPRQPPGDLKVVSPGGRRGCCSPGTH